MEEMFDTYDINGNYLGIKPKSFCHGPNPNCYHKPVWIWIINSKNKILIQRRSPKKRKSPNKWDMPSAGHVHAGETSIQGAIRETKEELGIYTSEKDYEFIKEYINEKGYELAQIYLLKLDKNINDFTLQKEEVAEVKWVTLDKFKKIFYSDEFCNHSKEYKDYIVKMFEERLV